MKKTNPEIVYGNISKKEGKKIFVSEKDFETTVFRRAQYSPEILKKIQNSYLGQKHFLELFLYDGISLYWFFYPTFWAKLNESVNFLIKFDAFLDTINPISLYVNDDFSKYDLIKQVCQQKNIVLRISKWQFFKSQIRSKITPMVRKIRLNKLTKLKIKKRAELYKRKFDFIPSLENKIVFASPDVYRRYLINENKGVTEEGEFFVQDIIELLPNKNDVLGIALDYDARGNLEKLVRRLDSDMPWLPVEILLKNHNKNYKHKEFLKKYSKLIKTNDFQSLFVYNNISLWKQLEPFFQQMQYAPYLPLWLNLIDSLKTLFLTNKPKAIFLPYETGPLALAFIVASKPNKITTIGIQHGVIADNWRFYSFDPLESKHYLGFPLPDKILLFGEYSKQILLKNGYHEDKLISFGNPVFFNLSKKEKILENLNIHQKYNIQNDQHVILFTTISLQKFKSWSHHNHNTEIWQHLLENFADNKNFFLILKPHPDEDPEMYEKIAKKYNSTNVLITKQSLYELAFISNVVVSMFSTAIIDSLCFKKPVIQVQFDDIESPIPFNEFGVVVISNSDELASKIHEVLYNNEINVNIIKNSSKFLKDLYNIPENNPYQFIKPLLEND